MDEPERTLDAALGHTFRDPKLLELALTHRSAAFEATGGKKHHVHGDNERMEFLGDAVLAMVVSDALWLRCPDATEGELTRMRAATVNETRLAEVASALGLGEALRLGRGEDRTGGRAKPSLLANTLEAVFAAVYLDGGIERAREVILGLLGGVIERVSRTAHAHRDEKTALQELMQARHNVTPRYDVVATDGPDHDRTWHVEVQVGDLARGRGSGRSKKAAEQEAARVALRALEEAPSEAPAPVPGAEAPQAPASPVTPAEEP